MSTSSLDTRRKELNQQMIALYDLAQEVGQADFVAALELAAEEHMYGAESVRAIVSLPMGSVQPPVDTAILSGPLQAEVERDLAPYEHYVAHRDSVLQELALLQGAPA
jgi:hypothetical protein